MLFETLARRHFKEGALVVRLPGGRVLRLGDCTEADAPVVIAIHDNATLARLARDPELALGEAYMDGGLSIERGDLYDFLDLVMANRSPPVNRRGLLHGVRGWLGIGNTRGESRTHVAHHYDLSDDLFDLFLDEDRQYSCAYFAHPGMSLEEAQGAKKRHIAAKLLLTPGQRVLDIGSGWGGLALTLAHEHGVDVTGVTLSSEQLAVAQRRSAQMGLSRHARFALQDYRDVTGQFDRIVSVGMFEHVGAANYQMFFDKFAGLLKDDGVALLHTIGFAGPPADVNAWTEKYIFPGGHVPSLSEIMAAVERSDLFVTDIEILRIHYADTLRAWRERFKANWNRAAALYDERFCRMWEFYLAASEASFRAARTVVFQLQLARRKEVVPLTRDYITDADRAQTRGAAVAAE